MYINFFVYSLCIYCAEFTINFSGFLYPAVKTLFLTIVLPGVFVMARLECCRKTETVIFAARTNLPVSYFQNWQVGLLLFAG